ncbi:hypothetical protein KSF_108010 [Reticulibacter mediterranei]|uniref:Uncharacterized protein n=1 Tax=Reticulibacter mediterranei TaxID=2778369 RepID=A0A8J3IYC8_9CHLR|nr:hypothetical protein [Reticulibacter mediterranei]GHP00754.1 hypothetical protein KSF_108010 [Reticulibacter mediterranei]
MFDPSKCRGNNLRTDLRVLAQECEREAMKLAVRVRARRAGYRARGRAEALRNVARWLEKIAANSFMLIDLATNVTDAMMCLRANADDEEDDAKPKYGKHQQRREVSAQRRFIALARGRAGAYAEVGEVLSHLLLVYYPAEEFPLTLAADSMSYDEWLNLAERDEMLPEDEGAVRSEKLPLIGNQSVEDICLSVLLERDRSSHLLLPDGRWRSPEAEMGSDGCTNGAGALRYSHDMEYFCASSTREVLPHSKQKEDVQ